MEEEEMDLVIGCADVDQPRHFYSVYNINQS